MSALLIFLELLSLSRVEALKIYPEDAK